MSVLHAHASIITLDQDFDVANQVGPDASYQRHMYDTNTDTYLYMYM